MRRRLSIGTVMAVTVLAAGCTDTGPDQTVEGSPVATSSTAAAFGSRQVALGCSDSIDVQRGELIDEVPFRRLSTTDAEPPSARDVLGFQLPLGEHWYFRKVPLSVRKGAVDFTLSLSGPAQALSWVPASVWTTQGQRRPDLATWAAQSVTLQSCPDRAAMFLGGILAKDLDTCLHLTMRQAGQPEHTVRQRLDGSRCTE
ncbi:MAG: hypothetical protein ABIU87_02490 [Ornithinibacter sp.]